MPGYGPGYGAEPAHGPAPAYGTEPANGSPAGYGAQSTSGPPPAYEAQAAPGPAPAYEARPATAYEAQAAPGPAPAYGAPPGPGPGYAAAAGPAPGYPAATGPAPHHTQPAPEHAAGGYGAAPNGAPPAWGAPDATPTPSNQPLRPPADPWAGAAPLHHPPGSPWATPPGAHGPAPAHPQPGAPQTPPGQPAHGSQPAAGYPAPGWSAQGDPTQPQHVQPAALPPSAYQEAYQEQPVRPTEPGVPTAEEFARRRAVRPPEPVARTGVRAAVNKTTLGLVKLAPGRHEQEFRQDVEKVRRNFGGLRQVTVVNPKGGAGKTVAVLLLAMTFGQKRGGYVLAWDNNETQGTLGMRAQQDFHSRTVRDMLRDLPSFQGARGRVGDLSQYVRAQGEGMFDVLASDESATAGEMLTAHAFGEIREVVSRFYKLIFVDTGNNVRAQNWQAAIDATDQLVLTMSARNDSAETAARMLDHLEQTGRTRLVRQAVTIVSMPSRAKDMDLAPIQRHFEARTRAVLPVPYDRQVDTGEPLRYGQLSSATLDAWLKVAAAVSEGL